MSDILKKAREYEAEQSKKISDEERPFFHLTPYVGWMNDPNGFSFFNGKYHLFYQYNPYAIHWDKMHWGHAVSSDLLHWEYLPASLAPDAWYDRDGCFSGGAIAIDEKTHLLIYTGVLREKQTDGTFLDVQTQCIATGDGENYTKYVNNPVIDEAMLPEGASRNDFRDPRIWKLKDGRFCAAVASRAKDKSGQILLFTSENELSWKYWKVLAENKNRFGKMWECPDFFELDGKYVLIVSPQDMRDDGKEFHNGNGTLCIIGDFDEKTGTFIEQSFQTLDSGLDFYAPQTVLSKDNRRILIGWMQNWDALSIREGEAKWTNQMTLPRELFIKNGRVCQKPSREFDFLRTDEVEYKDVLVNGEVKELSGISGRVIDMELLVKPKADYYKFTVKVAENEEFFTSLSFSPLENKLTLDRRRSGSRRALLHSQNCFVKDYDGELSLRIVLDRFSVEVFINGGEQAMSAVLYTPLEADNISFCAMGNALFDIKKYSLK